MTIQMLMKVSLAMFQMLKVVQLRPIVRKMKDLIGTKWKEEQLNKKIDKKWWTYKLADKLKDNLNVKLLQLLEEQQPTKDNFKAKDPSKVETNHLSPASKLTCSARIEFNLFI